MSRHPAEPSAPIRRRSLRRWAVPGAAVASMVLPILISGCFEIEGPDGCMCLDCYDQLVGIDQTYRELDSSEPDPQPEDPNEIAVGGEPGDPTARDPRRKAGGRIPEVVTRPNIDSNLRGNQGSPRPSGLKY